jgi:hypothetical protein
MHQAIYPDVLDDLDLAIVNSCGRAMDSYGRSTPTELADFFWNNASRRSPGRRIFKRTDAPAESAFSAAVIAGILLLD